MGGVQIVKSILPPKFRMPRFPNIRLSRASRPSPFRTPTRPILRHPFSPALFDFPPSVFSRPPPRLVSPPPPSARRGDRSRINSRPAQRTRGETSIPRTSSGREIKVRRSNNRAMRTCGERKKQSAGGRYEGQRGSRDEGDFPISARRLPRRLGIALVRYIAKRWPLARALSLILNITVYK